MITNTEKDLAARAAALFVSTLSAYDRPTAAQAQAAIDWAMLTHGGPAGLAGDVAQEYGEHPELAAARMRWARGVVADLERVGTARTALAVAA